MGGCCICFALVLCMHYLPARLWHSMCVGCGVCARARVCVNACVFVCARACVFLCLQASLTPCAVSVWLEPSDALHSLCLALTLCCLPAQRIPSQSAQRQWWLGPWRWRPRRP